ncbi:bifunctional NAD(P)/FAD-dependent oxidoreductase/class I SAM-dependent methyltransferase [Microbacterium hominis]|uniref:bifunctional NAD(P)/FAD-dependent oxidoreductase/class I SAM-dependent methyltransferase n=1 Tax=Microbacterium hominis TaxID=162426 RepID=UPI001CC27045|nr:bifunctional NAD(P)/FAD-dependent oxidoreductase/class I SAM-dependent methyltransferase [Microbacterium hominis]
MQEREWDAVVIGGGAAGLSAAQMLGRARHRTLVIDGGAPRNAAAEHMHAVLGHDGIAPAELLARGRDEVARYGVRVEAGEVGAVRDEGATLRITRVDGTVDLARALVIATGVRDVLPPVDGIAAPWGRSVLHCPYCHGYEVADARLGVLATSAQSLHQIELVRQWSADLTAFTAAIEPLDETVRARLRARGIRIVDTPVTGVRSEDGTLRAVQDAAGGSHGIDALFVAPTPVVDVAFADALGLARADLPGSPLAVDVLGATSHPRVWAAGNVVAPYGNVPVALAAGSMAGAGVNAALAAEDADLAVAARARQRAADWEQRYAERDRIWSGRVNAAVAAVAGGLEVGTALEIGCGEGADAVWLAERGWRVTAVDLSPHRDPSWRRRGGRARTGRPDRVLRRQRRRCRPGRHVRPRQRRLPALVGGGLPADRPPAGGGRPRRRRRPPPRRLARRRAALVHRSRRRPRPTTTAARRGAGAARARPRRVGARDRRHPRSRGDRPRGRAGGAEGRHPAAAPPLTARTDAARADEKPDPARETPRHAVSRAGYGFSAPAAAAAAAAAARRCQAGGVP